MKMPYAKSRCIPHIQFKLHSFANADQLTAQARLSTDRSYSQVRPAYSVQRPQDILF